MTAHLEMPGQACLHMKLKGSQINLYKAKVNKIQNIILNMTWAWKKQPFSQK